MQITIVNGPNLNWLGKRETSIYGTQTWEEIFADLQSWGKKEGIEVSWFQSNHEGVLIDYLQKVNSETDGVLFNPGAYAHTSIALRDCVASLDIPVVEVHLSRLQKREPFRRHSYIAEVAQASIAGFGPKGYMLALELLKNDRS